MPAKAGASHGIAAFVSILLGATIEKLVSMHTGLLADSGAIIGGVLTGLTGVSLPETVTGLFVISTLLAFLWGIAYHYTRHGGGQQNTPKNYAIGSQPLEESQQMSAHVATVGADSSAQVYTYRTLQEAHTADEELASKLERDFSEVAARLGDIHDNLYDEVEFERAERVHELLEAVVALERKATNIGRVSTETGESDTGQTRTPGTDTGQTGILDEKRRHTLATTHHGLSDATDDLVDVVTDASRDVANVDDAFFDDCEILLHVIERARTKRQDVITQSGERE